MKNAILATGSKKVARKLKKFAKNYKKQTGCNISEAIEFSMREPEIWEGELYFI